MNQPLPSDLQILNPSPLPNQNPPAGQAREYVDDGRCFVDPGVVDDGSCNCPPSCFTTGGNLWGISVGICFEMAFFRDGVQPLRRLIITVDGSEIRRELTS